jgi:Fe-S-cluster containining protein
MTNQDLPPEASGQQLGPDDEFCFGCHAKLGCFNRCCADVNILLTPLDVLRLARRRNTSTSDFLEQHTLLPVTKDLHLPLVVLRMGDDPDKRCPFVGPQGCTVYEDRPWACRMFPLGEALPPARAGVQPKPIYFLQTLGFCQGPDQPERWTTATWRESQGVIVQEELEQGYRELVSHPWFIGGRQLDPKRMEMFHMACYDLDKFRRFVFESSFLRRFELPDDLVEQMRESDHALLKFAFTWLRYALFAEPTMKVRGSVAETGGTP